MELWAIAMGLCMGLVFYLSLTLYRETAYMMPIIIAKYNSRKHKNRKFSQKWSIDKVK
jgi:hypothetical protein